jgi:predicted transcriptional regulator
MEVGNEFKGRTLSRPRQIVTWGDWVKGRSILTSKIESEIELLERHVTMLKAIMEHEPIGIIRLSEQLNVPQHKVRYSLRILEQEGLIAPSPEGAVTTEKLPVFFNDLRSILTSMDETVNKLRASLPTDTGRPGQKA